MQGVRDVRRFSEILRKFAEFGRRAKMEKKTVKIMKKIHKKRLKKFGEKGGRKFGKNDFFAKESWNNKFPPKNLHRKFKKYKKYKIYKKFFSKV